MLYIIRTYCRTPFSRAWNFRAIVKLFFAPPALYIYYLSSIWYFTCILFSRIYSLAQKARKIRCARKRMFYSTVIYVWMCFLTQNHNCFFFSFVQVNNYYIRFDGNKVRNTFTNRNLIDMFKLKIRQAYCRHATGCRPSKSIRFKKIKWL